MIRNPVVAFGIFLFLGIRMYNQRHKEQTTVKEKCVIYIICNTAEKANFERYFKTSYTKYRLLYGNEIPNINQYELKSLKQHFL